MTAHDKPVRPDTLEHMPAEVREHVARELPVEQVVAWSVYDLSARGEYATGYLILGAGRLGNMTGGDSRWCTEWIDLNELAEATVIEGVGMSLLRLNTEQAMQAEFRFTSRHAKVMAELHQHLVRQLPGEGPEQVDRTDEDRPAGVEKKKIHCDKCDSAIPDWAESCPRCLQRRKVLSRLLEFIRPHKGRAWLGFSMALVALGMSFIRPWLTRLIVDDAILDGRYDLLTWLVTFMAVTFLAEAVLRGCRGRLMAGLGMRVAAEIRDRCYQHLHKLSLAYFSRKTTGGLITRVTSDSDRVWDFVAFHLVEIVLSLLTFVGVGALLFVENWQLASLVLIPIPGMLVLMTVFHKRMYTQFARIWRRWAAMTAVVADAIPGMRVIKAFGQEGREVARFHDRNYQVYEEEGKIVRIFTFFGPTMMLATHIGFIIIWAVGGAWCIRDVAAERAGGMTIGTLLEFQVLMMMFYRPIHMVAQMSRMFNRAATSVQRIFEVLDTAPEIYTRRSAQALQELAGRIELRNVSFSYDGVRRVLRDINLVIEPGEMIGLVGHSGSGKSTLINLVCRFYDPDEGRILIDGVDVRDCKVEDLRRHIGVVLQEPYLFRGTVTENIAYGNPDADVLQIIAATRAANVHDAIVCFPDGYDTLVGERGHTLSGGEKQRVSIARAVLNNPKLLVLDEATSNVDTETETEIQKALDRLVADRTTIAIAHRLSTLSRAHRLVVLKEGRIVEQGTHAELQARTDGVYANLLKMQAELKSVMALRE